MSTQCFLLAAALVATSLCHDCRAAQAPPAASAIDYPGIYRVRQVPSPDTLKLSLRADRTEFFLGENILLHYCIENQGQGVPELSTGGDYRGGTRADRFKVSVIDGAGREMPDPHPRQGYQGGMMSPGGFDPKPGQTWFEDVFLLRYRSIEKPGDYTVTVFHDLGWGPRRTNDSRVVSIRLQLKMPTSLEAFHVIAAMEKAMTYTGKVVGRKGQPTADFSRLKYPVYLPQLSAAATLGAVQGLAEMPTVEATCVLLRLVETPRAGVAHAAMTALSRRIPLPEDRQPTTPKYWSYFFWNETPALMTNAWDATLAAEARRSALRLIAQSDDASLVSAATMLTGLATQEDLPELFLALDRSAWRARAIPATNKDHYEGPRWACRTVTALLEQLARGGLAMPAEATNSGQLLAFLAGIAARAEFRPAGWETTFAQALEHERGVVREAALRRLPHPAPEALARLVLARMTDPEPMVRQVAGETASRLKIPAGSPKP